LAGEYHEEMAKRRELWQTLRIGDRIRLVEMPPEFFRPGYFIHRDTLRAYQRLLARGRPLRVDEIDAWGLPYVHFRFRCRNGRWEYHRLAVNHDGIAKVKPRK
jgi:hypothetical protein